MSASTHRLADHLAAYGRNGDEVLVHMTKDELAGLASLGPVTINPNTGLPEASMLGSILSWAAPLAATFFTGGAINPWEMGLLSGGINYADTGDLSGSLMKGLTAGGLGSILGQVADYVPPGAGAAATMGDAAAGTAMNVGSANALGALGGTTGSMANSVANVAGLEPAIQGVSSAAPSFGDRLFNNITQHPIDAVTAAWDKSKVPFYAAGMGASGLAQQAQLAKRSDYYKQMQEGQTAEDRRVEAKRKSLSAGAPAPMSDAELFDTYSLPHYPSGYAGGGIVALAKGGLAPMPGMEREVARRRSGAALLRKLYPSKQAALADMHNPDSPIAQMGISNPNDPLLQAAFGDAAPSMDGIGAFASGGQVRGPGDGRSDSIAAVIDGHQPAALSSGEFVVPAHAVSRLGNGSTEAGANQLHKMLDRLGRPKTLNPAKVLPA